MPMGHALVSRQLLDQTTQWKAPDSQSDFSPAVLAALLYMPEEWVVQRVEEHPFLYQLVIYFTAPGVPEGSAWLARFDYVQRSLTWYCTNNDDASDWTLTIEPIGMSLN